jgi:hypothetical protein
MLMLMTMWLPMWCRKIRSITCRAIQAPVDSAHIPEMQADRESWYTEECRFHRRRHHARIQDIDADVCTAIQAADRQIGAASGAEALLPDSSKCKLDTVRRATVYGDAGEPLVNDDLRTHQRLVKGNAVARGRLHSERRNRNDLAKSIEGVGKAFWRC